MNLDQIPNEILVRILSLVSQPKRMAEFQLQSKRFKMLVKEHYFEHITGLTIAPNLSQPTVAAKVSLRIHCPLFTETIECNLETFGNTFELLWRKSPNISRLTLTGASIEPPRDSVHPLDAHNYKPSPQCPLIPYEYGGITKLLKLMEIITNQQTCETYPRRISQFDCIIFTHSPLALDRYISSFRYYRTMLSNWKSTLKTTTVCIVPEIQESWMDLLKETPVENITLVLQKAILAHMAASPPSSPPSPHWRFPFASLIPLAHVLERLKQLLHQPNRVIRHLYIHVGPTAEITHLAERTFHILLTELEPVTEFSLGICLLLKNGWENFLMQQPKPIHLTPFCKKLEILHLDAGGLDRIDRIVIDWPIWNIFPNLKQVTGIHLAPTLIDRLAASRDEILNCTQHRSRELILYFQPIARSDSDLIGRFVKGNHNYQLNIPPETQFRWTTQRKSRYPTLHLNLSCGVCEPSLGHGLSLVIPTRN
jgi:hypothetical protein